MKEPIDKLYRNLCTLIMGRGLVCVVAILSYKFSFPYLSPLGLLGGWVWLEIILGIMEIGKINQVRQVREAK